MKGGLSDPGFTESSVRRGPAAQALPPDPRAGCAAREKTVALGQG